MRTQTGLCISGSSERPQQMILHSTKDYMVDDSERFEKNRRGHMRHEQYFHF